ncbi:MAG: hypothetical protein AAGJ93_08370 [Bacteroidota bacterium]
MKYLSYLVCLALAITTSGCFEMLEDIYLNNDGTGKYQITVDMSGMFDDPFMGEMMKKSIAEQTGGEELEIDSLINFSEISPGGLPPTLTDNDRELIGCTEIRMRMSEKEKIGNIIFSFPFESMDDLNDFQETFARLQEESEPGSGAMSGLLSGGISNGNKTKWSLSGRTLNRDVNTAAVAEEMEDMDDETMEMMKMFLADATFTTTYHLPGKVKKCSIPGASVDGKMVSLTYSILDAMEEQPDTGGTIKFKKK